LRGRSAALPGGLFQAESSCAYRARDWTPLTLGGLRCKNHFSLLPPPTEPPMPPSDQTPDSAALESLQKQLLRAAGGSYSVPEAAERLSISERAVRGSIARGTLLGVRFRDHLRIPACQVEDGQILSGLGDVLRAMPVQHPWTQLGDLLEPLYALGGDRSLLDLIREGDAGYAVELASRLHATGGL